MTGNGPIQRPTASELDSLAERFSQAGRPEGPQYEYLRPRPYSGMPTWDIDSSSPGSADLLEAIFTSLKLVNTTELTQWLTTGIKQDSYGLSHERAQRVQELLNLFLSYEGSAILRNHRTIPIIDDKEVQAGKWLCSCWIVEGDSPSVGSFQDPVPQPGFVNGAPGQVTFVIDLYLREKKGILTPHVRLTNDTADNNRYGLKRVASELDNFFFSRGYDFTSGNSPISKLREYFGLSVTGS